MLRIEKHLGTKRTDWAAYGKFDYTRRSNGKPDESWYLVNNKDRCRFLEGTKCGIYEHRPAACRNFPFFPEHMEPNKWESLSSFCPGINKGKEWSPEEVASIVDEQKRTDAV
jgi:Fe-S-cluster containining protein